MPFHGLCPNPDCGASYTLDDDLAGRTGRCKKCGWKISAETPLPAPDSGSGRPPARPTGFELPSAFGRYRIFRKLGQGGMGTVYLAHDTQLDRSVALKVPFVKVGGNPEVLARFRREARAAARFRHPNFCPIYDVGQIDGTCYLAMAYIDGQPLSTLIDRDGPMPPRRAAELVYQLARALAEAHRCGVIHRDLKPANIMVDSRGELVIMDFGVARLAGADDPVLTQTEQMIGTPAYMSPEQVKGDKRAIGPMSDIYSLGVILYELLTGLRPFEGPAMVVAALALYVEPPPPTTHQSGIDPELEAICLQAMAKQTADRYPTMETLAAALGSYLNQPDSPLTSSPSGKGRRRSLASRLWLAAIPIVVLVLLLGVILSMATDTDTLKAVPRPALRPPQGEKETSKETQITMTNAIGMTLKLIPAGEFDMGSPDGEGDDDEHPRHHVRLTRPFYLADHEVTQGQYGQVMGGQNPSRFKGSDSLPVETVSWFDALEFCNRLSEREGLPPYYRFEGEGDNREVTIIRVDGTGYRLPTEAEWEYACRAGLQELYGFGDDPAQLPSNAWLADNSGREVWDSTQFWNDSGGDISTYRQEVERRGCRTHPSGQKPSNGFGLFDMHGNVWEWCWDRYDEKYYKQESTKDDPFGPDHGNTRVVRGGAWNNGPTYLRSAFRFDSKPMIRNEYYGFRPARTRR